MVEISKCFFVNSGVAMDYELVHHIFFKQVMGIYPNGSRENRDGNMDEVKSRHSL